MNGGARNDGFTGTLKIEYVEIFGWTTVLVDGKVADLKGNTMSSITDFKSLRKLYMMD